MSSQLKKNKSNFVPLTPLSFLYRTKNIFPKCKIFTDNKILDKRDYRVSSKKLKDHLNFEAKKTVIDAFAGSTLIAFGLSLSVLSLYWQNSITQTLTSFSWSSTLELWLPFWPFEPFLSLMIIGLGTMMLTKENAQKVNAEIVNQE